MEADYKIHTGWGDHIEWMSTDWDKVNLGSDLLSVYGHMIRRPNIGQTLMGEFEKSFIKFEFVDVEYCHDPDDMFFGKVKAISQEMK